MARPPDTALGKMYEKHIELIINKDLDGLLSQYTEDAVLISSFMKTPLYFRGHEQLKEHFKGLLDVRGLSTDIAF